MSSYKCGDGGKPSKRYFYNPFSNEYQLRDQYETESESDLDALERLPLIGCISDSTWLVLVEAVVTEKS
jgi:hypothetical protein